MSDSITGGNFILEGRTTEDIFTPEDFTEEHKMILETCQDFIGNEVLPKLKELEEKDETLTRKLFGKAGELGFLGTDVPEEYGGIGLDKISTTAVTEAFGPSGGFAVTEGAHTGIGTLPIVYFGTPEQKEKYLPKLATGEWIAAFGLTEPGAGSDALNAKTKAVLSDDGKHYILNGEKIFITNASWADLFIIFAKIDGQLFSAFIVEKTFEGLSIGAEEHKLGIVASSTASVIMEDVKVPVENLLGEIGKGHVIALNVLDIGRYKLGAAAVGGCKYGIREAVKYANTRMQFNTPVSQFGIIKEKLADMAIQTFVSETQVYAVAGMIDAAISKLDKSAEDYNHQAVKAIEEYSIECAINKVACSEAVDFVADEFVQVLGGYGYIAEYPAEQMYRDSRINRIFEGTNEVNRLLIPGTILKRALKGRLPLMQAAQKLAGEVMTFSPLGAEIPDGPLGFQMHMLEMTRKAIVLVAGVAAQKYMDKLMFEQEILARLADMCISLFNMECIVLRTLKKINKDGEEKASLFINMVQAYMDDTLPKVELWGKQVLARVEEGDMLRTQLMALRRFTKNQMVNSIELKRKIGDEVIRKEAYPIN